MSPRPRPIQDLDVMSTTKMYGGSLITTKYAEKSEYIFISRAIKV